MTDCSLTFALAIKSIFWFFAILHTLHSKFFAKLMAIRYIIPLAPKIGQNSSLPVRDMSNSRAKPKKSFLLLLEKLNFQCYWSVFAKQLLNSKHFKQDTRPIIFCDVFLSNNYLHQKIKKCAKCILHISHCISYAILLAIRYFGHQTPLANLDASNCFLLAPPYRAKPLNVSLNYCK